MKTIVDVSPEHLFPGKASACLSIIKTIVSKIDSFLHKLSYILNFFFYTFF
jgi:hypothetical protein